MLETCRVTQYPFTPDQPVQMADWELYIQVLHAPLSLSLSLSLSHSLSLSLPLSLSFSLPPSCLSSA